MKIPLPDHITTIDEAKALLTALHTNGEAFHPEDDANELCGDPFTRAEGDKLNRLMNEIYQLPGNSGNYPHSLAFDPCGFYIDLMNADNPPEPEPVPVTREIITIPGTKAYWEGNPNQNGYFLLKPFFVLGNKWGDDKSGTNTYGWASEITYGENEGKFTAGYPTPWNDDTESDAVDLGIFETMAEAMQAVITANHPETGTYC